MQQTEFQSKFRSAPANPHLKRQNAQNLGKNGDSSPENLTFGSRFLLSCLTNGVYEAEIRSKIGVQGGPEIAHLWGGHTLNRLLSAAGRSPTLRSRKTSPLAKPHFWGGS
jgi:hypothetical protein